MDINSGFSVVTVTLEDREGGELFVYSDDLPGLILSGTEREAVCECIIPAIEAIYRHQGIEVSVHTDTRPADALNLKSPRKVDMHVQRFIVEVKRAA